MLGRLKINTVVLNRVKAKKNLKRKNNPPFFFFTLFTLTCTWMIGVRKVQSPIIRFQNQMVNNRVKTICFGTLVMGG